jgi:hypothetical protein
MTTPNIPMTPEQLADAILAGQIPDAPVELVATPTPTPADMLADAQRAVALADDATKGPWEAAPWNTLPNGYVYGPAPIHDRPVPPGLMQARPPISLQSQDAAFVAASRELVPLLASHVKALTPRFERGAGWLCDGETLHSGEHVLRLVDALRARIAKLEGGLREALTYVSPSTLDCLREFEGNEAAAQRNTEIRDVSRRIAALLANPEAT